MTFTQLRTFALVAELGSLRAAAEALGVSEPAVSAAVAALRTDLGDPLFRRTGTGIALTPGGRALAARARELVRLAERTRREVAHATSTGPAAGAGDGGLRRARRGPGRRGLHPPGAARGGGPDRGLDRLRGGRAGGGRRRHRARGPAGADPGAGGRGRAVPAVLPRRRRGARSSPGRRGEPAPRRPVRAPLAHRTGRAGAGQRGGALGGPRRSGAGGRAVRQRGRRARRGAGRRGRDARARPTPSARTSPGARWSACRSRARR